MQPGNNLSYSSYSKPSYTMKLSKKLMYPTGILSLGFIICGILLTCLELPPDYEQGENYKIMFIHVPCAWLTSLNYFIMTILSVLYIITRHPLTYMSSFVISQLGILFTSITLITGSLWGLPTWGTFWVWDARLTSVLVQLFLYIGYLLMYYAYQDISKKAYYSSILCIIGFLNIPIIKYSVNWWSTLHQPASITKTGSAIQISMLYPLVFIGIGILLYCIFIYFILIRHQIIRNKVNIMFSNSTKI